MPADDGTLLGPGWQQVHEWPSNATAGPSRSTPRVRGHEDVVEGINSMRMGNDVDEEAEDGTDVEYETEEEELYFTLDFGYVNDPALLAANDECQIIGMDTPEPVLKIGNKVFQGSSQHLIGSEMIFRDDRDSSDPSKHYHRPLTHTSNRMTFRSVDLHPRDLITGQVRRKDFVSEKIPKLVSSHFKNNENRTVVDMRDIGPEDEEERDERFTVNRSSPGAVVPNESGMKSGADALAERPIAAKPKRTWARKQRLDLITDDPTNALPKLTTKQKAKLREPPIRSATGKPRPPTDLRVPDDRLAEPPSTEPVSSSPHGLDADILDNPLLARKAPNHTNRGGKGRAVGSKNRPIEVRMAEKLMLEERRRTRPPRKSYTRNPLKDAARTVSESVGSHGGSEVGDAEEPAGPSSDAMHFSDGGGDDEIMMVDG